MKTGIYLKGKYWMKNKKNQGYKRHRHWSPLEEQFILAQDTDSLLTWILNFRFVQIGF